eukprot:129436-Amphidinium_carterae.1
MYAGAHFLHSSSGLNKAGKPAMIIASVARCSSLVRWTSLPRVQRSSMTVDAWIAAASTVRDQSH